MSHQISPSSDTIAQVIHLSTAALDGELSAEDFQRLESLLEQNEEARDVYLRLMYDSRCLRVWADGNRVSSAPELSPPRPSEAATQARGFVLAKFHPQRHPMRFTLCVLTLTLIFWVTLGSLFIAPRFHPSPSSPVRVAEVVARLSKVQDTVWVAGQSGAFPNAYLRAGQRMELVSGLAELTYPSGAKVALRGPVDATLWSQETIDLHSGVVKARVTARGVGFQVKTPVATIIDLGTEFGVRVGERGTTEVHVFSGLVQAGVGGQVVRAGEAVRLMARHEQELSASIAHIPFHPEGFAFRFREESLGQEASPFEVLAYFRLGEDDPRAQPGGEVQGITRPSGAGPKLQLVGRARYTDLTAAPGSRLAIDLTDSAFECLMSTNAIDVKAEGWILEAWVQATSDAGSAVIVYNGTTNSNGFGLMRLEDSWAMLLGGTLIGRSNARVDVGAWVHLAAVCQQGRSQLWVDGLQVTEDYLAVPRPAQGHFVIGHAVQGQERFRGQIDEVRLSRLSGKLRPEMLLYSDSNKGNPRP